MTDRLQVLGDSVRHLNDVASKLQPTDFTASAYPSEWTIADTLSHLGSGAVIGERRFEDFFAQRESSPEFNTSVWDAWNAKSPEAQVVDCLSSDAAFLAALEAATDDQRREFQMSMGPFAFDFDGLVGLRLGEHVLHTWDVEVSTDSQATLSNEAANAILDSVRFIVSRTAKPTGGDERVSLRTSDPVRYFTLVLDVDSVDFLESEPVATVDLDITAEALVRLFYGRLDPRHTPVSIESDVLDSLRRVFPGF